MTLFLYVQVSAEVPYTYQNAIAEQLKIQFPEIIVYDCDNHSESFIIQAAVDLLDKSQNAIVWIEATGGELGKIRLILEKIIQHSASVWVVYNGFQVTLDHLVKVLSVDRVLHNPTEAQFRALAQEVYGKKQ